MCIDWDTYLYTIPKKLFAEIFFRLTPFGANHVREAIQQRVVTLNHISDNFEWNLMLRHLYQPSQGRDSSNFISFLWTNSIQDVHGGLQMALYQRAINKWSLRLPKYQLVCRTTLLLTVPVPCMVQFKLEIHFLFTFKLLCKAKVCNFTNCSGCMIVYSSILNKHIVWLEVSMCTALFV